MPQWCFTAPPWPVPSDDTKVFDVEAEAEVLFLDEDVAVFCDVEVVCVVRPLIDLVAEDVELAVYPPVGVALADVRSNC